MAIDSLSIDVILLSISLHPLIYCYVCGGTRLICRVHEERPHFFDGDPKFDAYEFFVGYHERLQRLGLVGSNGVDFTTF